MAPKHDDSWEGIYTLLEDWRQSQTGSLERINTRLTRIETVLGMNEEGRSIKRDRNDTGMMPVKVEREKNRGKIVIAIILFVQTIGIAALALLK